MKATYVIKFSSNIYYVRRFVVGRIGGVQCCMRPADARQFATLREARAESRGLRRVEIVKLED